jgi:exodeoxyribonuclease-3
MAYWSHRGTLDDAWKCYLAEADADFYLFQEGRPCAVADQDKHLVWNEIGGSRDWGSGIYSPTHEIVEEDIGSSFRGALTIGNANVRGTALTLVSLYGLMESTGSTKGYAIPNLHRMVSDLTGLLNGHIGGRRNIILGGDLNASTQLDPRQGNRSHELLFARIADFGLEDAHTLSGHEGHIQTLRHVNSKVPWHNDYMFLSTGLADRLKGYHVIDTDDVRQFSDHNIVAIDVEL